MIGPADTPQYFGEMRKFAQMPDSAWGYAIKYAAYIRNR